MKNKIIIALISFTGFFGNTQEELIKTLFENKQYDQIISEHSAKVKDYSAKAIYYVGMAYYSKAYHNKPYYKEFLKLMNLSIKKDKTNPRPHFIKGSYFNYIGRFRSAIKSLKKAIKLNPNNSYYLNELGNSHLFIGNNDKAIKLYKHALQKDDPPDYLFTQIAQVYLIKNDIKNALKSFYVAKNNISKETQLYISVLENIAKHERSTKHLDKALIAFKELNKLDPTNIKYYAEIIQVYNAKKDYEKAELHKQKLYENYAKDTVSEYPRTFFCFDKFILKGKRVHGLEQFKATKDKNYKHMFLQINENGKPEIIIRTTILSDSLKSGSPKYVLEMEKNKIHTIFPYKFVENFNYNDLKKTVILIFNKQIKRKKIKVSNRRLFTIRPTLIYN
ncbi:hypothetical protein FORMB_18280 [Formosa sp. Hel1_33_131]|mgnify:CR=1 FL=1|uniref:tetratricopeptide repeat protein n=1 Tax=Formosa sp. Hel1_33_131 TaxID=1336794 RepID=UPI00084E11EF|nr:tetratricopeptide repeat protein [Formosa sp. Hel1_33_131]AOR28860.1 hypothetical protein FORMB_18280 [Formosa sp. Hel1_33_131]